MNDLNGENLDKTLADLHQQFLARLQQRLADMLAHQSHLARNGWSIEEARSLERLAHGLVGAAGSFGLPALSNAARSLERLVQDLSHRDPAPADADIQALGLTLYHLAQQILSAKLQKAPALPRPARASAHPAQAPLVYVVDDDPEQAESLAAILREGGYRTRVFMELPAFHKAWKDNDTERPAAAVATTLVSRSVARM
ncbi:MAG: Hpt domain-containing protein, partial [Chromatiaceae bacterium]